jgi:excisionase family DNA binding protein
MDELLTARQVQEKLKVDRITVYRMLNDGRLKGVKIGQQWRFNRRDVDNLVGAQPAAGETIQPSGEFVFPVHCMQTIQNLFSEVGQISAVIIDAEGKEVTQISHAGSFSKLLMDTPSGLDAYRACWQNFAHLSLDGSRHFTCYAGLQYIGAPIYDKEEQVALFLAGEFYWQPPNPREEVERIRHLADRHNLSVEALQQAAAGIPVIAPENHARVESWPATAAHAIESILQERVRFIDRLQRIANLTQIS